MTTFFEHQQIVVRLPFEKHGSSTTQFGCSQICWNTDKWERPWIVPDNQFEANVDPNGLIVPVRRAAPNLLFGARNTNITFGKVRLIGFISWNNNSCLISFGPSHNRDRDITRMQDKSWQPTNQLWIIHFKQTKSRIDLKFYVHVRWWSININKHKKFQIDLTFRSSEISNWKLAAVDPRSHLIGIDLSRTCIDQTILNLKVNDTFKMSVRWAICKIWNWSRVWSDMEPCILKVSRITNFRCLQRRFIMSLLVPYRLP